MKPDQTKRMAEIVKLTEAIKRTDAAMEENKARFLTGGAWGALSSLKF